MHSLLISFLSETVTIKCPASAIPPCYRLCMLELWHPTSYSIEAAFSASAATNFSFQDPPCVWNPPEILPAECMGHDADPVLYRVAQKSKPLSL